MSFFDLLVNACEQNPRQIAVRHDDEASSFAEHFSRISRAAHLLRATLGLASGDRFAVLSRNSVDYLELIHASLLGAAIVVPLNVRSSESELAAILRDAGCQSLFYSEEFGGIAKRLKQVADVERIIMIGVNQSSDIAYRGLMQEATEWLPKRPDGSDIAFIMYTSGTTGRAKGVVIEHDAMANDIYKTGIVTTLTQNYTFLLHAPLFHIASIRGFGLAPATGSTVVLLPRFDPPRIIQEIKAHDVNTTSFIASTVRNMLELPGFHGTALPSLTTIGYGSAPMHPAVLRRLMSAFPDAEFVNWYGMTETCGHVSVLNGRDHKLGGRRLASCGRAMPGIGVRVVDEAGLPVGRGTVGEIAVSGDNMMRGYWNQPPLKKDDTGTSWYQTGDAGYLDEDGYLYLAGRIRDMIITGGENVAPGDVEAALCSHPEVHQAVVFGVDDPEWGEAVHACVSAPADAQLSSDQLRAHCRAQLAGYKVPKKFSIQHNPFPMSGSNKIDRNQVKSLYLKGYQGKPGRS
ncbi:class I adenylate-forming enzyme family protein [Mycolicibacterium frederiksbergense]|uniref:class I adenylate-forming enzyme family protein n=1 Tax=Mycolicibacterium frederiksbergense TaxID=117567 RepID=UPI00399AFBC6